MISSLSPKQAKAILHSDKRINILHGSVRSGKTFSSILRWIVFMNQMPEGNLMMIGKTLTTLYRNIIVPLQDIVGDPSECRYVSSTKTLWFGGRRIMLEGANDDGSEAKIRGLTLAGAYGDEITLWPESFWTMLLSRCSVDDAKIFATTNPDSPFHWVKKNYIDRAAELDMSMFKFDLEDNLTLSKSYVESLKREYTGLWYRRFILGEWCQAEGAVYDMWDESRHVKKNQIINPSSRDYSIDYGTSNPTVFIECLSGEGKYHINSEYYWDSREKGKQKTDGEYADDLVKFMGGKAYRWVIVDPSAASFIAELKRRKIKVQPAVNDVLDGIRETAKLLASDSLSVSPECSYTRGDFSSYVWDTQAQKRGEDKPLKQHDHAADAVRYWVMTAICGKRPMSINSFSGEVMQ